MSRAKTRGAAGKGPLLLLAGLPERTAKAAAGTINADKAQPWRAMSVAFSDHDPIYTDSTASELAALALAYAQESPPDDAELIDPTRIVLAFVDDDWTDPLWDGFGSSVLPVRMRHPGWDPRAKRHWRFDIETVNLMVRRALVAAESVATTDLRLRLEAHRRDDALLLPSRNFQMDDGAPLRERFRSLFQTEFPPADIAALDGSVKRRKYAYPELSKFYAKVGGRNISFAYDARKLVFAKARVGQDGGQHELKAGLDLTAERVRRELEGRFRFGTPLLPAGFQHDVQWAGGAPLVRERMDHVDRGPVDVFGDHANIFGSDVITAQTVETPKKVKGGR